MIKQSKTRNIVRQLVKSEILNKLKTPGCKVSDLAEHYNISRKTIYGWQQNERKAKQPASVCATNVCDNSHFALVTIVDQASQTSPLQKASLTFNDFSLTIEGKLKPGIVFDIMKILEESSC